MESILMLIKLLINNLYIDIVGADKENVFFKDTINS